MSQAVVSEGRLLLLIAAVQFVNVLDFMMVMPLGPDFAQALGIQNSELGLVGGSYTAAAAVTGLIGASFLDRFDRRKALAVALFGLVLGTIAGGFATGLASLLLARVVAGAFGGPATSLALAIIADAVPVARRGRAMGTVMGAFSVASVLGVPAGLELSRLGGWQMPFFAVGALGAVVATASVFLMPPMTRHLQATHVPLATRELLSRPVVLLSMAAVAVAMVGNFAIIPNLSAYWQFNRGYPRADLGLLYMVGGALSFATMRLSGRLADRIGPTRVAAVGTLLYLATLYTGFIRPQLWLPVMVLFVSFMVTGTFRMIPMQALTSRVPEPHERARFMSSQSAVQHISSAAGAVVASAVLVERADGSLARMEHVAAFSGTLALLLPMLLFLIERVVRQKEQAASGAAPLPATASPAAAVQRS
jgi:predicted MFS family arabinose efflux permease